MAFPGADQSYRKIKLCIEDIQGRNRLTDFHGMTLTRDKLCSLIRKWHSLIEAHIDVKTTDDYTVRVFAIGFTAKRPDQVASKCYAQTAQIRRIRKKMMETMTEEAGKVQLRDLVKKLIPESIGREIEKQTQGIFPLKDVFVRKGKLMKKPKFDITRLMELLETTEEVSGAKSAIKKSTALIHAQGSKVTSKECEVLSAVVQGLGQIVEASFATREQADVEEDAELGAHTKNVDAIMEMLADMEDKAKGSLTEARKGEAEAQQSHALLKQGLENEIPNNKESIGESTQLSARTASKLAEAEKDPAVETKGLAEDTAYLKDLKRDCQTRASEFVQ